MKVFVIVNLFYHNSTNNIAIFWRQKWHFVENDRPLAALVGFVAVRGLNYPTQFSSSLPLVQQFAC